MNYTGKIINLITIFILIPLFLFSRNNKYRAIWNNDPATTMTIGWNQFRGKSATVFYDTKDHKRNVNGYAYFQKVNRTEIFREMKTQFARLKSLRPNTKYYFIIKDSESVSQRFWFKTAPNNSYERLSIIAGGDSRNNRKSRQNANQLVAKLRPHCVLFGGDMTSRDNALQWKDWLDDWQMTHTKDGQMIPIIPARGNHEYSNGTIMKLFDAPNQDVVYGLTFGGNLLRTYTLNSLIAPGGKQRDWLENDLRANNDVIWKMAQYHHPIRPHTKHKKDKQKQYNNWSRLFYDYQVQLVVESDAHVCKTTYPLRPTYQGNHDAGFVRDDNRGTTYIGEGCWGAPVRPANDNKKWTRASGSFNQFKWLFIDENSIEIRTIKTDNAAQVAALSEYNIFQIPNNIDIWKPNTGAVITISRRSGVALADIEPSPVVVAPKSKNKLNKRPKKQKRDFPLLVSDFDVKNKEGFVSIKWNTLSCPNSVSCEIQRSETGMMNSFKTIGLVNLRDGVELTPYLFKDKTASQVKAPFVHYRLKNKLSNGDIIYSERETSLIQPWGNFEKVSASDDWAVYVEFDLKKITDVSLKVFNEAGQAITEQIYPRQMLGDHIRKIDVILFKKGKYLIQINKKGISTDYKWFEK